MAEMFHLFGQGSGCEHCVSPRIGVLRARGDGLAARHPLRG